MASRMPLKTTSATSMAEATMKIMRFYTPRFWKRSQRRRSNMLGTLLGIDKSVACLGLPWG